MRRRHWHIFVVPALAGLLVGCAAKQPRLRDAREVGPLLSPGGARQSLALSSPAMQQAPAPPGVPWYASRNDRPDRVAIGLASPTVQSSFTRTVDRLHAHDGEVFDHYSQTTYQRRYRRTVH